MSGSVPFRDVPPPKKKKVKTGWDEGWDDMKVKGGKGRSKERKGRSKGRKVRSKGRKERSKGRLGRSKGGKGRKG